MFNISNKSLTYLFVNTSCMIANAYLAPKTFTISFAIGATLGLGMGLKHRIDILLIDQNEKAVKAVTNQSAQVADKANQMTASLQAQAKDGIKKAGDTTIGKTAVHYANSVAETTKPFIDKASFIARPLLKLYLRFSWEGQVINTVTKYTMGFDEQRLRVIKRLNPIPGIRGTILSVGALAANIGYLSVPLLSKMWVLSGFTAGYASGLYLLKNSNWNWLQSEPYQNSMKAVVL